MVKIPENYTPSLGLYETQKAIGLIKNVFLVKICAALHLKRVTAPLFVDPSTGLNDDLNGVERPVEFDIPAVGGNAQVVHSLAKWKRLALHDYGFYVGNGLVADMNAIRRDEELDNLHSIYVDQWDWEKVIDRDTRNMAYLEDTVRRIVSAICGTLDELKWQFSGLSTELCRDVYFITAQELEDRYPDLTPKQRENVIVREHRTVFIEQIGGVLKSGKPHDGRAPDYDDWSARGAAVPQNAFKRRATAHHRRRHRAVAPLYASARQSTYRRGASFPLGRGDSPRLCRKGRYPAVIVLEAE